MNSYKVNLYLTPEEEDRLERIRQAFDDKGLHYTPEKALETVLDTGFKYMLEHAFENTEMYLGLNQKNEYEEDIEL